MPKVYIDASSLIHWLNENPLVSKELKKVLTNYQYACTSSICLMFADFKLRQVKTRDKAQRIKKKIATFDDYTTLDFTYKIYKAAKSLEVNDDFEDACQIATAIHNKIDTVVTSDLDMYSSYKNIVNIIHLPYK